ncbi:hypothetical protein CC1G_02302 [Coprinopsis cinerea okayama7|uniref:F-box domain-containing protein n=1 Tax=Coprinopsis cinerea (strain Okayama-7 / 130 / ATCC MYA-4618 / FGSC 9003) TaxID=240176 RepID=A8N7P5_COPC7|nr:hypothetical protein CC1G_02302 [Coprinopsis cinerea okayama7\|eukprot:XP_001830851.2 hypothetical protein CC1G_02302 [Coprinopsis cinerea okayama7\
MHHKRILACQVFDKLPVETLGRIIYFAAEAASEWWIRGKAEILSLTHVSQRWRTAALTQHSVWKDFEISLPRFRCRSASWQPFLQLEPLMELWFRRAGSLPKSLSLVFQTYGSSSHSLCAICSPHVQSILRKFGPWRSVSLRLGHPRCVEKLGNESWNSIENLSLYIMRDCHRSALRRDYQFPFASIPTLTMLKIDSLDADGTFKDINAAFFAFPAVFLQRLVDLKLYTRSNNSQLLRIVQQCSSLEHLSLAIGSSVPASGHQLETSEPLVPFLLPVLKSLSIDLLELCLHSVLGKLICPQLIELTVEGHEADPVADAGEDGDEDEICFLDILDKFIDRSSCALRKLDVSFPYSPHLEDAPDSVDFHFVKFLQGSCRHLTSLSLSNLTKVTGSFLQPFYCPTDNYLPRLEIIRLLLVPKEFKTQSLFQLISARWAQSQEQETHSATSSSVTPLKKAEVTFHFQEVPNVKPWVPSAFFEAIEGGLKLDVTPTEYSPIPKARDAKAWSRGDFDLQSVRHICRWAREQAKEEMEWYLSHAESDHD